MLYLTTIPIIDNHYYLMRLMQQMDSLQFYRYFYLDDTGCPQEKEV